MPVPAEAPSSAPGSGEPNAITPSDSADPLPVSADGWQALPEQETLLQGSTESAADPLIADEAGPSTDGSDWPLPPVPPPSAPLPGPSEVFVPRARPAPTPTVSKDLPAPFPADAEFLPETVVAPLPAIPGSPARIAQRPDLLPNSDTNGANEDAGNDIIRVAADRQLKPITAILPYYDYAPDDADPCEFLCPSPGKCGDEQLNRPCPVTFDLPSHPQTEWQFPDTQLYWAASNFYHNPLYFEDFALERYGHTHHHLVEPFVSLGKFSAQFIGMPYQLALHPVCERQYTLGWYRPGDCVPKKYYQIPWNTKAAISAAAAYTGLIFLFP